MSDVVSCPNPNCVDGLVRTGEYAPWKWADDPTNPGHPPEVWKPCEACGRGTINPQPERLGVVADAGGGGEIRVLVDRELESYPAIGTVVYSGIDASRLEQVGWVLCSPVAPQFTIEVRKERWSDDHPNGHWPQEPVYRLVGDDRKEQQ